MPDKDEFQPVVVKTYKDPDIIKIEQIDAVLAHFENVDFQQNFMKVNHQLLMEYRNAIILGVCPNFVRTYTEKYEADQRKQESKNATS